MASIQGQILVCDRCGTNKFFESGGDFSGEFEDVVVDGCGNTKTLCNTCYDVLENMKDSFWKGIECRVPGIYKED